MLLGHLSTLSISDLSLDLLASPSSSLDSTWLEFTVALGVLDQSCDPLRAVVVGIFSVGEGVCQVPASILV